MSALIPCFGCKKVVFVGPKGRVERHKNCTVLKMTPEQIQKGKQQIEGALTFGKSNPAGKLPKLNKRETQIKRSPLQGTEFPKDKLPDLPGRNASAEQKRRIEKERARIFALRSAWVKQNKSQAQKMRSELDLELPKMNLPGVRKIVQGGSPGLGKRS